jgi:MFS family permease
MLPVILTASRASGSFAVAGAAAGAFSLAAATSAPVRGRLIDTRAARWTLPPMVSLNSGLLILFAAVAGHAPTWFLICLAGLAGGTNPPLVAAMRLEWQRTFGSNDPRLAQAYAFDSAAQTTVFVIGPFISGITIGAIGPRLALTSTAAALLISTVAFALMARSQPGSNTRKTRGAIHYPGIVTLVIITALADIELGSVNVLLPAVANRYGHAEAAGPLLAAFAFGSVVGALAYGSRAWSPRFVIQFVAFMAISAITVALLALPASILIFALTLPVAGVPSGAKWAATSLALDLTPARGNAESFTWLSFANALGVATGNLMVGAIVDGLGSKIAFLLTAVAPILAMVSLLARRNTLPAN